MTKEQMKARLEFIKACIEALNSATQREKAFCRLSEEDSYLFQLEYEGYFDE